MPIVSKKKTQPVTLTAKALLARLKARGMTKWAIKKALGVSWETVNTWSKGHGEPTPENAAALASLYQQKKAEKP